MSYRDVTPYRKLHEMPRTPALQAAVGLAVNEEEKSGIWLVATVVLVIVLSEISLSFDYILSNAGLVFNLMLFATALGSFLLAIASGTIFGIPARGPVPPIEGRGPATRAKRREAPGGYGSEIRNRLLDRRFLPLVVMLAWLYIMWDKLIQQPFLAAALVLGVLVILYGGSLTIGRILEVIGKKE